MAMPCTMHKTMVWSTSETLKTRESERSGMHAKVQPRFWARVGSKKNSRCQVATPPKKVVSFKKLKIQPKNQDYYTLNHKIPSPPPSTAGEKEGQKAHRAQLSQSHLRANLSACWILRLTTE